MMIKYIFLFITIMLGTLGCNTKKPSAGVSDKELSIQAMEQSGKDEIVYNIRIFPSKALMENASSFSQNMMFQVDSCFYLSNGLQKVYPLSADYIPGGVAKSFEYLVTFERGGELSGDDFVLFYQDKYINKKNYQLLFK